MMFRCFFRVGQQLLAAVSYGKRYGLNENAGIYRFDPETGALTLLHEEDESLYSSVGSDCRLGGGKSWGTDGKSLYHLTPAGAIPICTGWILTAPARRC